MLADFEAGTQRAIYYDSKYGMNNAQKLMTWVIATDGDFWDKWIARQALVTYFKDYGMTIEKLLKIVGEGSMLQMIISPIRESILLDPAFGWCPSTTSLSGCKFETKNLRSHLEDIVTY